MPKCIELLPHDWLISNLCYQAIDQVYLIKWPVSVYTTIQKIWGHNFSFLQNEYFYSAKMQLNIYKFSE